MCKTPNPETTTNGEDSTQPVIKPDLNVLLSYPIFWKASKVCKFLKDAAKFLRDEKGKKEIIEFKDQLNRQGQLPENRLWPEEKNWKDFLDELDKDNKGHFEFLTTRYNKGQPHNNSKYSGNLSNVSSLFDVVRDKYEHSGDFPQGGKDALGWFTDKGHLDETLFVEFWDSRFPRLVSFLWLNFYEFHESPTLNEYYPYSLKELESLLPADLEDVLEQMEAAFSDQLDQGQLKYRSKFSNNEFDDEVKFVIEFRVFPVDIAQKLLDSSSCRLEIEVLHESVLCKWYDRSERDCWPSPIIRQIATRRRETHSKASLIMVIGVSPNHLWATNVKANFCRNRIEGSKAIYCGEFFPDKFFKHIVEDIRKSIKETHVDYIPVQWADLSKPKQKKLKNEATLCFQGRKLKLKDVLPVGDEQFIYNLEGDVLNELLQNNTVNVFRQFELPSPSPNYRKRRLVDRTIISSRIFEEIPDTDLFVILNCSFEDFVCASQCTSEMITVFDNSPGVLKIEIGKAKQKIILLKNRLADFSEALNGFEIEGTGKNVHILAHLNGTDFQWLATKGDFSYAEEYFAKARAEAGLFEENTLIRRSNKSTGQMIFIADKPGMGKTQILMSLASRIATEREDGFVIFLSMTKFLEGLDLNLHCVYCRERYWVTAECIITALFDVQWNHLEPFEKMLLTSWLENPNTARFKVELILDGLDEVPHRLRTLAFLVLQAIKNECLSVRVWVTLRDHMLEDTRRELGCLGYKLQPFSKEDQVALLISDWLDVWRERGNEKPQEELLRSWRNFAETCLKLPPNDRDLEVAGIPLQCQMIAEINVKKVMSGDFDIKQSPPSKSGKYTLIDLYDDFMERKLEIYFNEKKNLSNLPMKSYVANITRREMERTHSYFSLRLLFPGDVADKFCGRLLINQSGVDEVNEAVEEQGIIQKRTPLTFTHRTFAEFFAAKFCFRVLTGEYMHIPENEKHFLFTHLLATSGRTETGSTCEFRFPVVAKFLDGMWEKRASMEAKEFKRLRFEALCKISRGCDISSKYWQGASIFAAAKRKSEEESDTSLIALFFSSRKQILALFTRALQFQCYEYCQYVIDNYWYFNPWRSHQLKKWSYNRYGLLHWVVSGFAMPLENECHVGKLNRFLSHVKNKAKYSFCSLLEERDKNGRTPLMLLLHGDENNYASPAFSNWAVIKHVVFYFIYNLKADLCATDYQNNTVLHLTTSPHGENPKEVYNELLAHISLEKAQMRKMINSKNKESGRTPLLQAVHVLGDLELDTLSCFKHNGADFNAQDKNGWTVLHIAVEKKCSFEFIQKLIEFGVDILRPNRDGVTAVDFAVEQKNSHLVNFLLQSAKQNANNCEYTLEELRKLTEWLSIKERTQLAQNSLQSCESQASFKEFRKRQSMIRRTHIDNGVVVRSTSQGRFSFL